MSLSVVVPMGEKGKQEEKVGGWALCGAKSFENAREGKWVDIASAGFRCYKGASVVYAELYASSQLVKAVFTLLCTGQISFAGNHTVVPSSAGGSSNGMRNG